MPAHHAGRGCPRPQAVAQVGVPFCLETRIFQAVTGFPIMSKTTLCCAATDGNLPCNKCQDSQDMQLHAKRTNAWHPQHSTIQLTERSTAGSARSCCYRFIQHCLGKQLQRVIQSHRRNKHMKNRTSCTTLCCAHVCPELSIAAEYCSRDEVSLDSHLRLGPAWPMQYRSQKVCWHSPLTFP